MTGGKNLVVTLIFRIRKWSSASRPVHFQSYGYFRCHGHLDLFDRSLDRSRKSLAITQLGKGKERLRIPLCFVLDPEKKKHPRIKSKSKSFFIVISQNFDLWGLLLKNGINDILPPPLKIWESLLLLVSTIGSAGEIEHYLNTLIVFKQWGMR